MGNWLRMNRGRSFNMRLQALYFIGALAVTAILLSAGAQSLPANPQWTTNAQAGNQAVQQCPRAMIWSLPDISRAAFGTLPSAGRAVASRGVRRTNNRFLMQ
jgi:hypothetical protein